MKKYPLSLMTFSLVMHFLFLISTKADADDRWWVAPKPQFSIPEPKAKVHCTYDGKWYSPEDYKVYCKPPSTSEPHSTTDHPKTPSVELKPEKQMQIQMFQSIVAPMFNFLGNMISQSLIDSLMPQTQSSNLQGQQEEIFRKQQEEAKKKALEAWNKYLMDAQEQARREAVSRQKAGQDILSQVRIGSGPFGSYTIIGPRATERETLSKIDWDNPRSQSAFIVKTTESAKEQLLKAAYFSKMAETFLQSGDLEAARFYAGLAFEGDTISPRSITYAPPKELLDALDTKKATELNNTLTKMAKFFKLAMPELEKLERFYTDIEDIKTKKEKSKKKIEEIEKQIKELESKKQIEESTDKKTTTTTEDLLAQALAFKKQAEDEYQEVLKTEQKLIEEKQMIDTKLNKLKEQLFQEMPHES